MEQNNWSGVEAAIFDLDGTLADSLGVWEQVDRVFFERRGMELPADYQRSVQEMGFSSAAAYTKRTYGLPQSEEEIIAEWNGLVREEYARRIELKPGVPRYLRELKARGVRIGLATASGKGLYEPLLARHGVLPLFSACVSTDEVGKDKSSPDVYLACARRLCAAPRACVVFEDLLPALRAAKGAGMRTAAVLDRQTRAERAALAAEADTAFCTFAEAPALRAR